MSLEDPINPNGQKPVNPLGKTIDLQGVAAFVGLVELLAQELGTTAGRIQGLLPSGPASFEELVGEISVNSQGFQRSVTLFAKPQSALKMYFQCAWRGGQGLEPQTSVISGVEAHFLLDSTVEQIVPQGRALARQVEEAFALLDRMVTLGQSGRLAAMSIPTAELEAFEQNEAGSLVKHYLPKSDS